MSYCLLSLLSVTSFFRLNQKKKKSVALSAADVAIMEHSCREDALPVAPENQSLLWDECQNDIPPETSPALPGLLLHLYQG